MTTEQGQKIAGALKAIIRMHSDTSKLLIDCDKHIGRNRKSIFGSYATRELTWNVQADYWMAHSVYRYYEEGPSLVDGVHITFFHAGREMEPVLKVARIAYKPGVSEPFDSWDIWWLYFEHLEQKELGSVLECADADEGRIAWARLIAVPLFSIARIEDVTVLMNRVIASSTRSNRHAQV
jgi:hypothetical protein